MVQNQKLYFNNIKEIKELKRTIRQLNFKIEIYEE